MHRRFVLLIISLLFITGCRQESPKTSEPTTVSQSHDVASEDTSLKPHSAPLVPAQTMESESSKAAIEKILPYAQASVDHKKDYGLILSVITKDGISIRSLGYLADLPNPLEAYSEIGSITKVFTGMALASMVNEGLVNLNTPLSTCLPEGVSVDGMDQITLGMLTTHTSGFPRLPGGAANVLKFINIRDPYINYSVQNLWDDLANIERKEPGQYDYSNYAVSVLGHALAVCAHEPSWQDLIQHRVIEVLGLQDVRLDAPTPLIQGHDAKGHPMPEWHHPLMGMAPAGAFRANIMALSKLAQKMISADVDQGMKMIQTSIQPIYTFNTPYENIYTAIGMNWLLGIGRLEKYFLDSDVKQLLDKVVWHNGMTGGYGAFIGVLPEKQLGIAILSDTSSDYSTLVAFLSMGRLLGESHENIQKTIDKVFTK